MKGDTCHLLWRVKYFDENHSIPSTLIDRGLTANWQHTLSVPWGSGRRLMLTPARYCTRLPLASGTWAFKSKGMERRSLFKKSFVDPAPHLKVRGCKWHLQGGSRLLAITKHATCKGDMTIAVSWSSLFWIHTLFSVWFPWQLIERLIKCPLIASWMKGNVL